MKTYREKILEIEEELDLRTFRYKDVEIWPVIRLSLILSTPKTNKKKGSVKKKLKFLASGLVEYIKWKLGIWPKSKNVFLTSSHYKVKEEGVWYDRIIDPFLTWLNFKGEDYTVFDFTNSFSYQEYNYSKKSIKVQPVIYLLSFFWKFQYIFSKKNKLITGNVESFNAMTKRKDLAFKINENFSRRLFLLEKQSIFFEKLLLQMSATRVGLVCYYDFKSMALTWASNRLNIPVIDIQHGVQHSLHLAYSKWPQQVASNSLFIPSHFYVWNQYSYDNISQWHNQNNIILGGNKWIEDRISFSNRDAILFTVQPLEDPIPAILIETIKNYPGDKKFYIRLHPQQLEEYSKIENFLREKNLFNKVNIKDATYKPLTEILAKTVIHITKSSSVTIEASYFNIPTILITDRGKKMYEPMLPNHFLLFAREPFEMLDYINRVNDLEINVQGNENSSLGNFENINDFY